MGSRCCSSLAGGKGVLLKWFLSRNINKHRPPDIEDPIVVCYLVYEFSNMVIESLAGAGVVITRGTRQSPSSGLLGIVLRSCASSMAEVNYTDMR